MLWASLPDSGASLPTLTFTPHRLAFTSWGQLAARFGRRPLKTAVAAAALHVHGGTRERSDSFDLHPEAMREREREWI